MANLFTLSEEYQALMDEILANDGELDEELGNRLTINQEQIEGKIKAYYSVIKHKSANEAILKAEIERLQAQVKSNNSVVDRLKDVVSWAVDQFGGYLPKAKQKSLVFDTLKVSNKETDSVVIDKDFEEVIKDGEHDQYYNYKVELTLNPNDYKRLILVIDDQELIAPTDIEGESQVFIPISIKSTIVPNKTAIKEYYENRQITIDSDSPIDTEILPVIPGCSISHNLTPIFK